MIELMQIKKQPRPTWTRLSLDIPHSYPKPERRERRRPQTGAAWRPSLLQRLVQICIYCGPCASLHLARRWHPHICGVCGNMAVRNPTHIINVTSEQFGNENNNSKPNIWGGDIRCLASNETGFDNVNCNMASASKWPEEQPLANDDEDGDELLELIGNTLGNERAANAYSPECFYGGAVANDCGLMCRTLPSPNRCTNPLSKPVATPAKKQTPTSPSKTGANQLARMQKRKQIP